MRKSLSFARVAGVLCLALAAAGTAFGQFGINTRSPNTTLAITSFPNDAITTMQTVRVFPQISFTGSVFLTDPNDGTNRLFLVTKDGIIRTFLNVANPSSGSCITFLDINVPVHNDGEQGLLGLAFDPDFATNGEFYVYYCLNSPLRSRISRFTANPPNAATVDPATEEILITVNQPFTNHKGGMLAFGPDNMLYASLGDGGSGGDPNGNGQNLTTLLGKVLRIDVRGTPSPGLTYKIPPDNPFVSAGGSVRKEIWAYGFRNPWRFSFDRLQDHLYLGDVGQESWEEVDVVRRGENYGWKTMEGAHCYPPDVTNCVQTGLTLPIIEYSRDAGDAITGGYVYYGSAVPELYGAYIYGDSGDGKIYGLRYNGASVTQSGLLADTSFAVTSFAQDASGEVYVVAFTGEMYVLRPTSPQPASNFPQQLSDMPSLLLAGSGQGHNVNGVYAYEPSAKLWADGTLKERYFALPDFEASAPNYARFSLTTNQGWNAPNHTVVVKNFLLPLDFRNPVATAKRIETRVLFKHGGLWKGFTYEWNEAGTDATLLTASKLRPFNLIDKNGQTFAYNYYYPSRDDCLSCHSAAANRLLGLNTGQMNYDFKFPQTGVTANELSTFEHINLFDTPLPGPPSTLPAIPDPYKVGPATLENRARAYLAANCSICHRPGGPTPVFMDLRYSTPLASAGIVNVTPTTGNFGLINPKLVAPNDANHSMVPFRMGSTNPTQRMPPLATSRVDEDGLALIRNWIQLFGITRAEPDWRLYK